VPVCNLFEGGSAKLLGDVRILVREGATAAGTWTVQEPIGIEGADSEGAAGCRAPSSSAVPFGGVPRMLRAHATSSCSASDLGHPAKGLAPEHCRAGGAMRIFRFSAGGLLATRTCAGGVDGGVCMI
jgi:hypothetical protein